MLEGGSQITGLGATNGLCTRPAVFGQSLNFDCGPLKTADVQGPAHDSGNIELGFICFLFLSYSLHSTLFCTSFRGTAWQTVIHVSYNVFPPIIQVPTWPQSVTAVLLTTPLPHPNECFSIP